MCWPPTSEGYDAALTLDGLGVDFSGLKAVSCVSTVVEDGELRVLLGANGAGKTTLMDLISGKTQSTEGRVFLFDQDITNRDEHVIARSGIGRKFQIPSVFKELSVRRNLEVASCPSRAVFANLGFGFSRRDRVRVDEVLELIGLSEEADTTAAVPQPRANAMARTRAGHRPEPEGPAARRADRRHDAGRNLKDLSDHQQPQGPAHGHRGRA